MNDEIRFTYISELQQKLYHQLKPRRLTFFSLYNDWANLQKKIKNYIKAATLPLVSEKPRTFDKVHFILS